MLRGLFWTIVGAVAALQLDRWFEQKKSRFTPNAMAGTFLDKFNQRLESSSRTTS